MQTADEALADDALETREQIARQSSSDSVPELDDADRDAGAQEQAPQSPVVRDDVMAAGDETNSPDDEVESTNRERQET